MKQKQQNNVRSFADKISLLEDEDVSEKGSVGAWEDDLDIEEDDLMI